MSNEFMGLSPQSAVNCKAALQLSAVSLQPRAQRVSKSGENGKPGGRWPRPGAFFSSGTIMAPKILKTDDWSKNFFSIEI
jgi:hypothetical protein